MMKVTNYYDVKVVEIAISGDNNTGYFEDKITFIYNPVEDAHDGKNSLYTCCEQVVKEYEVNNLNNQCLYNAFATVYTLDRQEVNRFDVL
jgi:hypothetical protein